MTHEPTVALTMIVKDEVDAVVKLLDQALGVFDQMVIVVSDKAAYDSLKQIDYRGFDFAPTFYYRPWNNRFDEARNFAQSKVKTDFWFWIDADDRFDFSLIPQLVEFADTNKLDQLLLPYHYAHDEHGNVIALHWRERLFRTSHPFTWKGWIHETPISDVPYKAHRADAPVIHSPADDHVLESLERNHKILLEAYEKTDDPRYAMYLGASHHARGEHGEALTVLDKFIKVSGSDEDVYRALNIMSECAYFMHYPTQAINYALQAAALIPEYPQAYWLLSQWEAEQENWAQALEWVKVSETKSEPNSLGVYDPTTRDRARLIGAQGEFMQGHYNEALKWLRKVSPKNETRQDLEEGFINEADAETFIKLLPKFRKYFGDDAKLYDALAYDLKYDTRLRGLREAVQKPFTWPDSSIVILCGQGYEEWGPHTLDKGMGGSEEAVVYLSRELAKLGYQVTVYGAVEEKLLDGVEYVDGKITEHNGAIVEGRGVVYLPWKEFNRQDNFNVFVAWRAPEFTEHVNAKVKLADIHDVLGKDRMKPYGDVTYMVKSQYHRDLYPEIKDENIRVVGNGIKKEQFK